MPYYLINYCNHYSILKFYNLNKKALQIIHNKVIEYSVSNNLQFNPSTDSNDECSICMTDDQTSNMIKTNCNHSFHYNCIVNWIGVSLINNGNASCPYCRQNI